MNDYTQSNVRFKDLQTGPAKICVGAYYGGGCLDIEDEDIDEDELNDYLEDNQSVEMTGTILRVGQFPYDDDYAYVLFQFDAIPDKTFCLSIYHDTGCFHLAESWPSGFGKNSNNNDEALDQYYDACLAVHIQNFKSL